MLCCICVYTIVNDALVVKLWHRTTNIATGALWRANNQLLPAACSCICLLESWPFVLQMQRNCRVQLQIEDVPVVQYVSRGLLTFNFIACNLVLLACLRFMHLLYCILMA